MGQREDYMEIRDWQKFLLSFCQPVGPRHRLAFWTEAAAARVIQDDTVPAVILLDVPAERGSTAVADVPQGLLLRRRKTGPHAVRKSASCLRKISANSSRCSFIALEQWSGPPGPDRAGPAVPGGWWWSARPGPRHAGSARWFPVWRVPVTFESCGYRSRLRAGAWRRRVSESAGGRPL